MFEAYSYKKKFVALMIVFIMLSITAYKRSFATLFQVIRENKILRTKIDDINLKSHHNNQVAKQLVYLDKAIGQVGVSKEIVQQGIVSFAASKNPKISINDLQPIHLFSDTEYNVITNQLDITGNVNQLLQLGYDFEKEFDYSRIVSMKFYTSKKNNNSDILHLKIIFQNYENTK